MWKKTSNSEYDQRLGCKYYLSSGNKNGIDNKERDPELVGFQHLDWLYLGSIGVSGSVLVMWDRRIVEKIDEAGGRFSVSCKFKNVEDHFVWAFTSVYGPDSDRDRQLLWEELAGIHSWWNVPWCIGGDFNVVRFPSERLGANSFSSAMLDFSDFISEHNLIDLPLKDGTFTWTNSRVVASWSRLDRFLLSSNLEEHFPNIHQKRLHRLLSDHFPVLLEGGNFHKGSRPFRFENMWLKAGGFVEKVKTWWESYNFQGSPSFQFASKLKALKLDLKKWNVEEFGNVEDGMNKLWKNLKVLDLLEDSRPLSYDETLEKEWLRIDLEKVTLMVEICWRQKSRALWIREGDRNTKFFHRTKISHKRFNTIDNLLVEGELTSDPSSISACISHFYKQLYP